MNIETIYTIEHRRVRTFNSDPQRRCYNGCHAETISEWTPWDWLELKVPEGKIEDRLRFWRELNDYAVSQRGERATKEFRAVKNPPCRFHDNDQEACETYSGEVPCEPS